MTTAPNDPDPDPDHPDEDDDEDDTTPPTETETNGGLVVPNVNEWHEGHESDMSILRDCFCVNCEQSTGTTTMLPTKVPYFRELIIMHLYCHNCHFNNSEINFGGEIQEHGEEITLTLTVPADLNRQLIKSDSATLLIPCLDLEIPASTQRGTVSTIEGILRTAANNLQAQQAQRLVLQDLDNFSRCQQVIANLRHLAQAGYETTPPHDNNDDNDDNNLISPVFPFDIILNDIAGNSYIENTYAPRPDPHLTYRKYPRSPQQDMALGLQPSAQAIQDGMIENDNPAHKNPVNDATRQYHHPTTTSTTTTSTTTTATKPVTMHFNDIHHANNNNNNSNHNPSNIGRNEVMKFTTHCSNCHAVTETDMCIVDIPHFKEVIIMSMLCESCGFKSNEIKGGGGIPKYGSTITLTCTTPDDLAREVLKSDTAGLAIPELDLELEEGGLDGLYTTIEGLILKVRDRLESSNPFGTGDSNRKHHLHSDGGDYSGERPIYEKYQEFLNKLTLMSQGDLLPCTIVISDPLSNSFVGPIPKDAIALSMQAEQDGNRSCYDNYVDANMTIQEYTRTFEQNELLGLNDMKTENYIATTTGTGTTDTSAITTAAATTTPDHYYGTDQMEELPDRIRRVDIRGPDHPHDVGKAPVEHDTTIMGPGSLNYAVPSVGQRNTVSATTTSSEAAPVEKKESS